MKKAYLFLVLLFSFSNIAFPQNVTHYINAGSYYYSPSSLTINSGDTIVWLNDGGYHNVNFIASTITGLSFGNPESFSSSPTTGPILYTHVFTIPGSYNYDCSVGNHASNGMVGTLDVNNAGCTDPLAYNYDSLATGDDGSCMYIGCDWFQIGQDIDGEAANDQSGRSVSLSSDGSTVAIGAQGNDGNGSNSGHVRIYENIGGIWSQIGQDIDGEVAGDYSGRSVSLSSDGITVAIGAPWNDGNGPNSGHVRIYENIGGSWSQIGQDIDGEAAGDGSGYSVSLSSDGAIVAVGASANDGNGSNSGHVRIYENIGGSWSQIGQDIDGEAVGDYSGWSVSLSSDGSTVVIGAPDNDGNGNSSGHVRIYENIGGVWTQIGQDIDGEAAYDNSGWSVSLSSDGSTVAIGAEGNNGNGNNSGHVRIYENIGGIWSQIGQDIDGEVAGDYSGGSVSLSSDGITVAIGAYTNAGNGSLSGHVRVYENLSGIWSQISQDIDGEGAGDYSGGSVSLSSDGITVAIGAYTNDGNGSQAGHVRIHSTLSSCPCYDTILTVTACDSFYWDGTTYDSTGIYTNIYTSLNSCDSTVTLDLTINYSSSSTLVTITACNSFTWDGMTYDSTGMYTHVYTGPNGCDSTVTLDLTIIGSPPSTYTDSACNSFTWDGMTYDSTGMYTNVYTDVIGCDSIVTLDLFISTACGCTDSLAYNYDSLATFDNGSCLYPGPGCTDSNAANYNPYATSDDGSCMYISCDWSQIGQDIDGESSGNYSGTSVSLSSDGSTVAIGAEGNNGNGSYSGHVRIYENIGGSWSQIGQDIDGEAAYDQSGYSVSLSSDGSIVAIGAPYNDGNGSYSGHVRIYENIGGSWSQIGQDIDGEAADDYSAIALSLSSDGSIVAIGAPGHPGGSLSGYVRVFKNILGTWTQIGQDIDGEAVGDHSGWSVSLSSDGNTVAIGASNNDGNGSGSGHVRIYENLGGSWSQIGQDIDGEGAGDYIGGSVSLSSDGITVAIGARYNDGNGSNSGHVRIYENIGGSWTQLGNDIDGEAAGDRSGQSVSLSSDGNTVAIGANGNGSWSGHVRVYENISGNWTQIGNDIDGEAANDQSGYSVSLSSDGNTVAIGAPFNDGNGNNSGHVRMYSNLSNCPCYDTTVTVTACDSFDWDGVAYLSTGIYTNIYTSLNGCDSTATLDLTINYSSSLTVTITACNSFDWDGMTYDSTGIYTNVYADLNGCDSTVTLDLTINYSPILTFTNVYPSDSISCDGISVISTTSNISSYSWVNSQGLIVSTGDYAYNLCNDIYFVTAIGDGGCSTTDTLLFGSIYGCTDPLAFNYYWGATVDDGSCIPVIYGCTDSLALNYDSTANIDDGSCCLINQLLGQIGQDINGESLGDNSGHSVSLSSDGSIVAIGATGNDGNGSLSGHVRVYENLSGIWSQIGQDIDGEAFDDHSGQSVSLNDNGNILAVGAFANDGNGNNAGHVRVYENLSGIWSQIGQDIDGEASGDQSGYLVSLSSDGSTVAIGAPYNDGNGTSSGHVRIYENLSGIWSQIGQDIDGEAAGDQSGYSVSLSSDGSTVAIGANGNGVNWSYTGHVRIYENIGGYWSQIGQDIDGEAAGDQSGFSVSLSSDGSTVAIGTPYNDGNGTSSGHVRIYENLSGIWAQIGQDIDGEAAGDQSGFSVSLSSDGSTVVIGAKGNAGNGAYAGHARVYDNVGGSWSQIGQDIDGEAVDDYCGYSVSLSSDGSTVAIGATNNDDNGSQAGHVRVFNLATLSPCAGCTDPLALNYDSTFAYDDGSCVYPAGCTDSLAYNYDTIAITDDSTCLYCDLSNTMIVSQNTSGSCNGLIIANASSSNPPINYLWSNGNTSSTLIGLCSGVYSVIISDSVGCTIEDTVFMGVITGCTDSTASNYDPAATYDDGSCIYCIYGCMDSLACNYDSLVTCDDGSCLTVYGCTDSLALNYDSLATCDDGSCIPFIYGCTDSLALNYNSTANTDDGSCLYCVYGCMDSLALNYDALATCDNGSCQYQSNCTSPKPTGLYSYDVIDIRAKIGWNNMNDVNCMVWKYFVRYREVGTGGWTTKSAGVGNGLCNFGLNTVDKQLLNLSPSTTYEFKMKAFYCGGTSSNYSPAVQFTTSDVCPDMTNLAVQTFNGNQSKARFSWDTTGAYVFARILLRVDTAGATWLTAGGFGVYYPTLFVNKFGLQSGESYRAQGRTFCDSNITAYRSPTWTVPIFWTQPGSIRLEGGSSIANLYVYPNPSRDLFNISFNSETIQNLSIRILSVIGAEVYREDRQEFIGEYTKQISLDNYGKGIYFLEIETSTGVINKKLILQ